MSETSLPVTGGSGYSVAGYNDGNSYFNQYVALNDPILGNQANIVAGDTSQNGILVGPAHLGTTFSFTTTSTQTIDLGNYPYAHIQVNAQMAGSPSIGIQGNDDNGSSWFNVPLVSSQSTSQTTPTASLSSTGAYGGPFPYRYMRLNFTAGSSGTTSGIVFARMAPNVQQLITLTNMGASASVGDAQSNPSSPPLASYGLLYTGGSATWDRARTPNIFHTATATSSGNTAVWTPTSGKKFRVMAFKIEVTDDAAQSSGGDIDFILEDSSTATALAFSCFIPGTAATTFGSSASSGWCTLGNGLLSATANNVLNINLSSALTSGKCRVVAIGTEE